MSNLAKRSITALILGPLAIYLIYHGGYIFLGLTLLMFVMMMYEWVSLTSKLKNPLIWWIFGFFYIGNACFVMLFLERVRYDFLGITAFPAIFVPLILVWVADIFSYFTGRMIGGPKLWPAVSPGKTWSGAVGGWLSTIIFVMLVLVIYQNWFYFFPSDVKEGGLQNVAPSHPTEFQLNVFYISNIIYFIAALSVPVFALIGDLFESWIKRRAGVKDSGNIFPGHGGVLDRMDGVIMVMNVIGIAFIIVFLFHSGKLIV